MPSHRKTSASEADEPLVWLKIAGSSLTLQVLAQPGKSNAGFVRSDPRGVVVALHSPPEGGKANHELIELLAHNLNVPRSAIVLIRGATSRAKTLRIASANHAAVAAQIRALASGSD